MARSCAVFAKAQLQTSDDYLRQLTYLILLWGGHLAGPCVGWGKGALGRLAVR